MYQPAVGTTLGASVLGAAVARQAGSTAAPHTLGATVSHVAGAALPFTGFAFGLYLMVAICLIVAGMVMRRVARPASR
ncbi:MAG TPA: hypothetical protein VFA11_00100 [Acidimicrobiales bacterium]|nr:hypothetical protein [Acidimicrobiales bacterium]